jgi:ubiquitin carboxyl-terminal hydrolase 25/28
VNVANDGIDIYDGLSGYFDDVVEFQGRKARMEVTLVDLPPILQIQLQVGHSLSCRIAVS